MTSTIPTTAEGITARMVEVEQAAQKAAEERLEAAYLVMHHEEDFDLADEPEDGLTVEDLESASAVLAGPFDGCETCVVREVLDATWDSMLELARLELARKALAPVAAVA